jgi:glycerol-3-phosphate cytidylyltransferase
MKQAPLNEATSPQEIRVLAIGVFDLIHVGHLHYLEQARSMGSSLIVGIATDEICFLSKGKRPIMPEAQRREVIQGLRCVDEARFLPSSIIEAEKARQWMFEWSIDHVRVGASWEGSDRWTRLIPMLAEQGITVSFVPETPGISTTAIIREILCRQQGKISC